MNIAAICIYHNSLHHLPIGFLSEKLLTVFIFFFFSAVVTEPEQPTQSCFPSPCGPFSVCELEGPRVVCSCQKGYFGRPPNCHPECLVNGECPPNKACIRQTCLDPCQGTCGVNAVCNAINHQAICSCPPGYTGDPFETCSKIPGKKHVPFCPSSFAADEKCSS